MTYKSTDQLRQELMTENDLDRLLTENEENLFRQDLPGRLRALYRRLGISKSALAKRSDISEVYLHQVFSGRRTPSRDRLLCLCFGLHATVDETQELLRHAGHAPLYSRDQRDAIVLFALGHDMLLAQANDLLYKKNLEGLC